MLGSSNSIACANIMLNSAVAESLKIYADRLEGAEDFESALNEMIKKTIKDHKRILFNGNGYDDTWIEEATKTRGLCNYRTTPDSIPHLLDKKNADMLMAHGVFTEAELHSRYEITLENYNKTVIIEANTMINMSKKQIIPAVSSFAAVVADNVSSKLAVCPESECRYEKSIIRELSDLTDEIADQTEELAYVLDAVCQIANVEEQGYAIRDRLLPAMNKLRTAVDAAEVITADEYWPYPSYGDLLYSVR